MHVAGPPGSSACALTRDWRTAPSVGVIEPGVQSVAYMIHERAWRFDARRYPWAARG
ncbi:MAG: DUF2061 domain-containing protein [Hyphomonadaceae bacterium]